MEGKIEAGQSRQTSPTATLRAWFWASLAVGIAIVVRRLFKLPSSATSSGPPELVQLDAWFHSHAVLTYAHILLALVLLFVLPLLFWGRTREAGTVRNTFCALGVAVGLSAYAMSVYSVGGWVERSAVLLFGSYFLVSLGLSYSAWRRHAGGTERKWTLRAVAVLLGIATTRPVMGVFFATSRLTHLLPSQFFGPAFWIGFSINVAGMELWLRTRKKLTQEAL
jgi:prepilin signal peptidase PulO-like enzyme (type II secretory pathway)